jgi:hypothetical protein
MAKQQTLTIIVPDHEDDPADLVRDALEEVGSVALNLAQLGDLDDLGGRASWQVAIVEED